jgi:hypothetical protein
MDAEGWYVDPYGIHEARWMSDGAATALVRDGTVEGNDPPPETPFAGEPVPLPDIGAPDGDDLLRADDADVREFDPQSEEDSAWNAFGASSGGD